MMKRSCLVTQADLTTIVPAISGARASAESGLNRERAPLVAVVIRSSSLGQRE